MNSHRSALVLLAILLGVCLAVIENVRAQDEVPEIPTTPQDSTEEVTAPREAKKTPPPVAIELGKNWIGYSADEKFTVNDVWATIGEGEDQILVCKGKPFGYLRTAKEYSDYELQFEWKFASDPNGNSGILIHTSGADKIWPTAVQVQLHRPTVGSIFPTGEAKTDITLKVNDPSAVKDGWNKCEIVSKDGKIAVTINDKKRGEVSGCVPKQGHVAFQSEGAEVHFRKISLRTLNDTLADVDHDTNPE